MPNKGLSQVLRDFLTSVSLSNLMFVDVWKLFLIPHSSTFPYYQWKLNPAPLLVATMLDVLLMTATLFLAITLARRSKKRLILQTARFVFALVFVLFAANLLFIVSANPPVGPLINTLLRTPKLLFYWKGTSTIYSWLALVGLAAGCLGITILIHSLIFRRQQLIRFSVVILLITSPFVLITFAQGLTQWMRFRTGEHFLENAAPLLIREGSSGRRILWIIFDEMDFRLSFVERPTTLNLPEFDRLRTESLFAWNAYPPSDETESSLPALITGRLISEIDRSAPNELLLRGIAEGHSVPWGTQPNVFSRAREMAVNTGLAGWYHPYCRVIGNSLTQCSWEATSLLFLPNTDLTDLITSSEKIGVAQGMRRVFGSALVPAMFRLLLPKNPRIWREHLFREFNSIHQASLVMATDSNLQLMLVHYPIPHPPGMYDRYKDDFSQSSRSGYIDNLALADRTLKQLRQRMVEAELWENTSVLISSDHRLRADSVWRDHPLWKPALTKEDPLILNSRRDERVPFILKLAGENQGVIYEPAFNTVLSHDLILAILSGEVTKKEDVVLWLDRHRSSVESRFKPGQ